MMTTSFARHLCIMSVVSAVTFAQVDKSQTVSPKTQSAAGTAAGKQQAVTAVPAAQNAVSKISAARQSLGQGKLDDAAKTSKEARDEAKISGDKYAQAEAALTYGRTMELRSLREKTAVPEALKAYDEAASVGDAKQRNLALNSRGVLLLKQNDGAEALHSLQQINLATVEPAKQAGYRYNLARAYELNGAPYSRKSYGEYVTVLKEHPSYEPAAAGAFRVLHNDPSAPIDDAVSLASQLLAAGQIETVGQYMRRSLDVWATNPKAQPLLAEMLLYYAAAGIGPEEFRSREWPALKNVAEKNAPMRQPIMDIEKAFFGNLPPVFDPYAARSILPSWSREKYQVEAMSALLTSLGDIQQRQKALTPALAHYTEAWFLNSGNSAPAVKAAALLRDNKALLDSNQRLFEQLIRGIFEMKGDSYSKRDWPNILRMHVVLGTIYAREKVWGDEYTSHSAIFQWQHAVEAERQARLLDPNLPPSPVLYENLAAAYNATGKTERAIPQYFATAEGYLKFSNVDHTAAALERLHSLDSILTPQDKTRLRSLDEKLASLRAEGHSE